MKLGAVTKIDKRNKTILKTLHDGVISAIFDVTVVFLIVIIVSLEQFQSQIPHA